MAQPKSSDPLHGVTLERLLAELVEHHGWGEMGRRVAIRCFLFDPSIKSSLTFLRRTPWASAKVEEMYVALKSAVEILPEPFAQTPVHCMNVERIGRSRPPI